MERHHIAGKSNSDVTILTPANDHAELSVDQFDWPVATLQNPSRSELRRAAAAIRGCVKIFEFLVNKCLRPLPEILERLAEAEERQRKEKPPCKTKTRKK